jgi:uncharacterized membrane protein
VYHLLLDVQQQRVRGWVWLGWVGVNGIGFYVHYFFSLVLVAELVALLLCSLEMQAPATTGGSWVQQIVARFKPLPKWPMVGAIAAIGLIYLPWLPTFLSHISRPETNWANTGEFRGLEVIAPLYQLIVGWVVMIIALPVEQQPWWIAVPAGLVMLGVSLGVVQAAIAPARILRRNPQTRLGIQLLLLFCLVVVLEFLALAYLLGKDLTQVPRYNFIYYPAVCALLGATLSQRMSANRRAIGLWVTLSVGLLSSILVTHNLVFQKPYNPANVAQTMLIQPLQPTLVAFAYDDFQDIALGLSFSLGLYQQFQQQPQPQVQPNGSQPGFPPLQFVFLEKQGYDVVWRSLLTLRPNLPVPFNLWIVAPGLKRIGFPQQLILEDAAQQPHLCQLDAAHYHRLGIPYQLYRCR